jgi:hypothetical protein
MERTRIAFVNYTDWRGCAYVQFWGEVDVKARIEPLLDDFISSLDTWLPFDNFRLEERAIEPWSPKMMYVLRNEPGDVEFWVRPRGEKDSSMLIELVRTPEHRASYLHALEQFARQLDLRPGTDGPSA